MKKILVIFLILALMSIGGVNAAELDGNKTMVGDVLSVEISYENSTDLLSVGEKNVYIIREIIILL